ncbi:hypothetical protein X975_27018, partial [Stegodyphus mimosarum]
MTEALIRSTSPASGESYYYGEVASSYAVCWLLLGFRFFFYFVYKLVLIQLCS